MSLAYLISTLILRSKKVFS